MKNGWPVRTGEKKQSNNWPCHVGNPMSQVASLILESCAEHLCFIIHFTKSTSLRDGWLPEPAMTCYGKWKFPTANLLATSISGARNWWNENAKKTKKNGTVLEPCWNLSLLGCKAALMKVIIHQWMVSMTGNSSWHLPEHVPKIHQEFVVYDYQNISETVCQWLSPFGLGGSS